MLKFFFSSSANSGDSGDSVTNNVDNKNDRIKSNSNKLNETKINNNYGHHQHHNQTSNRSNSNNKFKWLKYFKFSFGRRGGHQQQQYFPNKQEKRFNHQAQNCSNNDLAAAATLVAKKNPIDLTSSPAILDERSKVKRASDDNDRRQGDATWTHGQKSRSQNSTDDDNDDDDDDDDDGEGSLARVVFTQIERHRQDRQNQELIAAAASAASMAKPPEPEPPKSNRTSSPNDSVVNHKLNVALNYLETNLDDDDDDDDPVYDIPAATTAAGSRSLINLANAANITEMNLPVKHQCTNQSQITYYHTSSPNLLAVKPPSSTTRAANRKQLPADTKSESESDDESIYDTPNSRS